MRHLQSIHFLLLWGFCLFGLAVPPAESAVTLDKMDLVRARIEYQLLPTSKQAAAHPELAEFYAARRYQPVWLAQQELRPESNLLLKQLEDCTSHGLSPDRYALARIHQLSGQQDISSLAELDLLLTLSFDRYCQDLLTGRTSPKVMDPRQKTTIAESRPLRSLEHSLATGTLPAVLRQTLPEDMGYLRLSQALDNYRALQTKGGWPRIAASCQGLSPGETHPAVPQLRIRLALTNDYHSPLSFTKTFDKPLCDALKSFQARHGLQSHGRLDAQTLDALNVPVAQRIEQIKANLERRRWGPRQFEADHILVNMADFRLNVIEKDHPVLSMKVIVGKPYRSTPAFSQTMTHLVLNPYWYVPQSIAIRDLLPKISRDPSFLTRQKFQVFRAKGNQSVRVDPTEIDWSSLSRDAFPFSLRQDPGPGNALGRIKFVLPNPFSVFLHDTPQRHLFDRKVRTYSSGCIRLEKPLELARYLLRRNKGADNDAIDHILNSSTQQVLKLDKSTPVHLVYWTAWVDQNGLQFREDVYKRNRKLRLALRD